MKKWNEENDSRLSSNNNREDNGDRSNHSTSSDCTYKSLMVRKILEKKNDII